MKKRTLPEREKRPRTCTAATPKRPVVEAPKVVAPRKKKREATSKEQRPIGVDIDLESFGWKRADVISWDELERALRSVEVPRTNGRKNVSSEELVESICCGAVTERCGRSRASFFARTHPGMTRLLARFGRERLPANTSFSSIQINRNLLCDVHVDSRNIGDSFILAVGKFTKGDLWTLEDGAVSIKKKIHKFDGSLPHATLKFRGERYSLVFFVHGSAVTGLEEEDRNYLMNLGFPLPSKDFISSELAKRGGPPKRVRITAGRAAFLRHQKGESLEMAKKAADAVFEKWRLLDTREATDEQLALQGQIFEDENVKWRIKTHQGIFYDLDLDTVCAEYYDFDTFGPDEPSSEDDFEFTPLKELMAFATKWTNTLPVWHQNDTARRLFDDRQDRQKADQAIEDAQELLQTNNLVEGGGSSSPKENTLLE